MEASETAPLDSRDSDQATDACQASEEEKLRRSGRTRIPTERMLAFQKEEAQKREKRLIHLYEQWKTQARKAREQLKSDIPESQIAALIDTLEKGRDDVTSLYTDIRSHLAPSGETRRRVDACDAVTKDIVKIAYERIAGIEDYDSEAVKLRLCELLKRDYARSVYGSTVSPSSHHSGSSPSLYSVNSFVAAKRADAAAELAAKEAEYEMLLEEVKQKEKIQLLEEQQKKDLEAQKRELERLKAEKDIRAARARLGVYNQEVMQEDSVHSSVHDTTEQQHVIPQHPVSSAPIQHPPNVPNAASPPHTDVSYLAQAVQDSIAMNRLPMPEPSVFTGDPIQFIEWRASFTSLIDRKNISSADKLHYLRRYVGGPARKTLDGIFYRTDDAAYKDAWNRLNHRYGQPFIIQRAFREKLANWPKIQSKDAEGFRTFADFLHACQGAMPHVKSLEILNDCEENQRLVQKLPDWAASRWNREVTYIMKERQEFPSFQDFVTFMLMEAEVACNPITSFHALRSSESPTDKRFLKERKTKSSIVHTQTVSETDNLVQPRTVFKAPCMLCQDSKHRLHSCPEFKEKSLNKRRTYVKEKKLCYGCLKPGHSAKECRHRHSCDTCKGRHPTCLHDNSLSKVKPVLISNQSITNEKAATTLSLSVETKEPSSNTSMIVPVWVSSASNPGIEKLVYALLDTQRDTVFIDQEVSHSLQAKAHPVRLKLTTMIGKDELMDSEKVSGLRVRGYNSATLIDLPHVYTKDCIPVNRTHIPTCETARQWNHLITIADEIPPQLECDVGLLIGYNCSRALAPRQVILGGENEPYAVRTDLGWSVVGCSSPHLDSSCSTNVCHRIAVRELPPVTPSDAIKVLESDFQDASKDGRKTVSQDDILFLEILKDSIQKNTSGHYEMPLPFKERPHLPDNKQLAVVRLNHLKRKLLKNETYKEHYMKFMSEVIGKGDAEEVHHEGKEGERWYIIPHHGVYHSKKPDKLRVVFDCSAKHRGVSLNNHLLSGPDMINNLAGVLIRFRLHDIALMCDIEKMFHQFHVSETDRDYLRFLWWKDGELCAEPQEFRMRVHLFGATSSPGCANYGLKHLAKENQKQFPLAAEFVLRDFYVDDGVTSVPSVDVAIQLAKEAQELCKMGGLRLHKFVSNSRSVLQSINPSERAIEVKALDLAFNDSTLERALGIQWHIESDTFRFQISLKDQPATRRGVLSMVASIYDPLGFVAPFLLNGKRVLQEMCRHGTGWDDPLLGDLRSAWERWKSDLVNLEKIIIPRCYVPPDFGHIVKRELHHFSDASTYGYGQCSYFRNVNEDGMVHCALVMAKSRVAPIKVITVPRLELTAAVVSVMTSNILKEELGLIDADEYFWTDSKVVLGYLSNEARRFHTFVSNRVQKIHLSTNPQQWRYVPTDKNPADLASRGSSASELLTSTWFKGPQFLWEKDLPPAADVITEIPVGDPEVKKVQTLHVQTTEKVNLTDRLSKFSSWYKATQAVARLLRCVKRDKSTGHSTVQEQEDAQRIIIKDLQRLVYADEIKLLSNGTQLPPQSKLHRLDVFLDQDRILKVGGRLKNASLPTSQKHPVIIPKDHHVTRMIIAHYHEQVRHQGKGLTINEVRSNGFWILGISRTVAAYIRQCVTCRKLRRSTEEQRMADLPLERVDPSPPFTYCGIDCFGPFHTKEGRKMHKRYGLLLTCLCCRAVHIEMLTDMSTDAFINGLRSFIAIRGTVRQIRCDQGSNFVGAKNELSHALKQVDDKRLAVFLAKNQCHFIMNAPHSSHTGGVWERQIRTVRNVLRATLSLSAGRLDDASLRTFFYEAMAIVNNRPLTVDNLSDPDSPAPLTPNHLLTMKSVTALPPPGRFIREDMYARKRWRHVQYLTEQFWSRWKREYLSQIATRQRWHTPRRNLKVGDIVVEKADDLPRNEWRLAKVVETVTDTDGLVRRVKIRLGDQKIGKEGQRSERPSIVERPVQKLIVLLETV
ncbi:uncharacterized protein LOC127530320 [Acanthochromis polyacanthus]|uniref:uncharacterized protein LOC127530320 n=1 Tax=Acanthochromis polyacanthus TaxID=80966 RepID=UPI0022348683|nr:uncharacterized protein LOC127530320 [Acanthochromis polyacanthus]